MTTIHDLPTPALLLDLDRLDGNLRRMAAKAERLGVALRPHIKTHKCVEVARRQAQQGCRGLTVSTLYEARVFCDHGFDDLTWAFPVILNRIDEAREVAQRCTLRLVVDSVVAIEALEASRHPFHVWLKVDCGYHRAGVDPASPAAGELAGRLDRSPTLLFDGLLTHSGHAYEASSREELVRVAEEERRVMVELARRLRDGGLQVPAVSVGSTPALAAAEQLEGVDEIRPGNYAFYDLSQNRLGSCDAVDCAVTVLASVVSSPPAGGHSVIDAGALALSKDAGPAQLTPQVYGQVFEDYAAGSLSPETIVDSLSQEHGILSQARPVGSRVRILPTHSCLTVAHFEDYALVQGEEVVDRWKIWRGR